MILRRARRDLGALVGTATLLVLAGLLGGCAAVQVGVYGLVIAVAPTGGQSPDLCERAPLVAYAQGDKACTDPRGPEPNPINSWSVNRNYDGVCALQIIAASGRLDLFDEAMRKGARPKSCKDSGGWLAVSTARYVCKDNPQLAHEFFVQLDALQVKPVAQWLLEDSVGSLCMEGVERALAAGASPNATLPYPAGGWPLLRAVNQVVRSPDRAIPIVQALMRAGGDVTLPEIRSPYATGTIFSAAQNSLSRDPELWGRVRPILTGEAR